ncbi:MAG TPA: hypothetical protein VF484_06720 [Candidatus Limnocylindrales bacterium]
MIRTTVVRIVAAFRQQPMRLLPLFLGAFLFLTFAAFVAVTGRVGHRFDEELPIDLPPPLADEVERVDVD